MINNVEILVKNVGKLDLDTKLSEEFGIPIVFNIDEIRKYGIRKSSFSKTIKIPGTKNNNLIFTHLYDIRIDGSFDMTQKHDCVLLVNKNPVIEGFMVLNSINKYLIGDKFQVFYEINIFDEVKNIFDLLGDKKLWDLDFSSNFTYDGITWFAGDHVFNEQVINGINSFHIPSWGRYPLKYPVINYGYYMDYEPRQIIDTYIEWNGLPGYFWELVYPNTKYPCNALSAGLMFPAVYVKAIFDRIFYESGLTYTSKFLSGDSYDGLFTRLMTMNNLGNNYTNFMNLCGYVNIGQIIDKSLYNDVNEIGIRFYRSNDGFFNGRPVNWYEINNNILNHNYYYFSGETNGNKGYYSIPVNTLVVPKNGKYGIKIRLKISDTSTIGNPSLYTLYNYKSSIIPSITNENAFIISEDLPDSTSELLKQWASGDRLTYNNGWTYDTEINPGQYKYVRPIGGGQYQNYYFTESGAGRYWRLDIPGLPNNIEQKIIYEYYISPSYWDVFPNDTPVWSEHPDGEKYYLYEIWLRGAGHTLTKETKYIREYMYTTTTPEFEYLYYPDIENSGFTFDDLDQIFLTVTPGKDTNGDDAIVSIEFASIDLIFIKDFSDDYISKYNETLILAETLPDMKQSDFLKEIIKMFNLYIIQDKFNTNNFIIEPYNDFFTDTYLNWSNKIDYSKDMVIENLNEFNAKRNVLKYSDPDDYYNQLYKQSYNNYYGNKEILINNQLLQDENVMELESQLYISYKINDNLKVSNYTPYIFKDKESTFFDPKESVKPLFGFEKGMDISIPFSNFLGNQLIDIKYNQYSIYFDGYDIKNGIITMSDVVYLGGNNYTLSFGLNEYTPSGYTLTLYDVFYKKNIDNIIDKNARLLTLYIDLNLNDIINLDFRKPIIVDNQLYLLQKIEYDPTKNKSSKVKLLKLTYPIHVDPVRSDYDLMSIEYLTGDDDYYLIDTSNNIKIN